MPRAGDLTALAKALSQQTSKPARGVKNTRKGADAAAFVGEEGEEIIKVTYYLEQRQARALKALASQQGRPVSDLAREIFDKFLEK